jgi:large subunit ribosomal protein L35
MPKRKTKRGVAKRVKVTAGGKLVRGHAYARHHLGLKSRKRKRKLDQTTQVSKADAKRIRKSLPYR